MYWSNNYYLIITLNYSWIPNRIIPPDYYWIQNRVIPPNDNTMMNNYLDNIMTNNYLDKIHSNDPIIKRRKKYIFAVIITT